MFIGSAWFDVVLPETATSLKHKRSLVKPVLAALRRLDVAVSEVGETDLHRRTHLGVAVVSGDHGRCTETLALCERLVADRPELELLSVRTRVWSDLDE